MSTLHQLLSEFHIESRTDCTLADLTTFKVGGPADVVLYPKTVEECAALLCFANKTGQKLVYLGNGSNILGQDAGCRDWILKTDGLNELTINEQGFIQVGAGVRTVKVSSFAAKKGLAGFEFAHGIPGTMGGAIYMNAGAYGGSMEQVVVRTHYLDAQGNLHTLNADQHRFGYRHTFFMEHSEYLIVGCELKLAPGDPTEIQKTIDELQKRRREKQPLEFPSAGSTFKRPVGYFAGKLIEDAGLKGYSVGDAQVSEKHAGFVINRGNATGAQVRQLIADVQKKVYEQFGVQLECEVQSLGEE
ncbi:MAG: UDP-N-acetylmuramate dehydrogenase [Clostridia bacterium]|nr:UDP-N-acetylmuramate dehydrogenase [Clostridia bacterium]